MNIGYPEVPPHLAKMSKSTKWFRKINGEIATMFAACIAVSAAPNRSYDIMTVIAGLLNAACHAKNITKIARAEREAERQRRGCRCKHKGKCKYACKCKKRCGCKYWRGDCPSHEYFRKALAAATEENAGAAFMEHVEHSMRMLRRARALRRGLLAVGLDKHGILRAARAPGLVFKRVNGVVGWHEIYRKDEKDPIFTPLFSCESEARPVLRGLSCRGQRQAFQRGRSRGRAAPCWATREARPKGLPGTFRARRP